MTEFVDGAGSRARTPDLRDESPGTRVGRASSPDSISGSGALVVYAESGSGKSALFAHWARQYRRKNPDAFVIEHYVGIGATSTDHLAIIRHIMMEIKERTGNEREIPSTPDELERDFPIWLAIADSHRVSTPQPPPRTEVGEQGREAEESVISPSPYSPTSVRGGGWGVDGSLVILIDGVNQLRGQALNLNWLPAYIPDNIRLIISSTVEQTLVTHASADGSRWPCSR